MKTPEPGPGLLVNITPPSYVGRPPGTLLARLDYRCLLCAPAGQVLLEPERGRSTVSWNRSAVCWNWKQFEGLRFSKPTWRILHFRSHAKTKLKPKTDSTNPLRDFGFQSQHGGFCNGTLPRGVAYMLRKLLEFECAPRSSPSLWPSPFEASLDIWAEMTA